MIRPKSELPDHPPGTKAQQLAASMTQVVVDQPKWGWRAWWIAPNDRQPLLQSWMTTEYPFERGVVWEPRTTLVAAHEHFLKGPMCVSPADPCMRVVAHERCGIHGMHRFHDLFSQFLRVYERYDLDKNRQRIVGTVWLWGITRRWRNGLQAQYAYPRNFVIEGSMSSTDRLTWLAYLYRVPLLNTSAEVGDAKPQRRS